VVRPVRLGMKADPAEILLVPFESRHRDATLRWMNDLALMPMLNRLRLIAPREHETWFKQLPSRPEVAYFAIEVGVERRHVGNIWLHAIDLLHRKAEVRIVIGEREMRGRGLGSAAIAQLSDRSFGQGGLHRLYAYVLAQNIAARRAFETAGFVVEGKLREDRWTGAGFTDAHLLARLRHP
jgi:RimJ/RimL family protein N-acetyltransferase